MKTAGNWIKVLDLSTLKVGDIVKYCSLEGNKKYWCGDGTTAGGGGRVVFYIDEKKIKTCNPDDVDQNFMSELINDEWSEVYVWVSDEQNNVEEVVLDIKKSSAKIATIHIERGCDEYCWLIELPFKSKPIFESAGFYNRKYDAIRAAVKVCKQLGILYTVSKELV